MAALDRISSGKYRVRWVDPVTSKRVFKLFDREREAKLFKSRVEVEGEEGTLQSTTGDITFGEWAALWLSRRRKRASTIKSNRQHLRNHVLPAWRDVPLRKITKSSVVTWVASLTDPDVANRVNGDPRRLSPASVEKSYRVFAMIVRAAYEEDVLTRLPLPPARLLELPHGKVKKLRFLTPREVSHLAGTMRTLRTLRTDFDRFRAAIYVLGYCGLRISELAALRLDHIDWLNKTMRVDTQWTADPDEPEDGPWVDPKTFQGIRTVPIADVALDALREHVDKWLDASDKNPLLFTGPQGGPMDPNNWRPRVFQVAAEAAGLTPLTPHDLRHTAASIWIRAGLSQFELKEYLGHKDIRVIDKVYGHLYEETRSEAQAKISQLAAEGEEQNNVVPLRRAEGE